MQRLLGLLLSKELLRTTGQQRVSIEGTCRSGCLSKLLVYLLVLKIKSVLDDALVVLIQFI